MKPPMLLSLLLAFLASLAFAIEADRTVDIFAWPLADPKPQTLASITYNSTFATLKSYHAPRVSDADAIVRIGFHHPSPSNSDSWSGIATAASNLGLDKDKTLQLLLNADGDVYHVGFRASKAAKGKYAKGEEVVAVELVPMRQGSTVHLNKPVVLTADGKVGEQEPEKTFLQKYWWAIAGFLLVQVISSASGGGEGGK